MLNIVRKYSYKSITRNIDFDFIKLIRTNRLLSNLFLKIEIFIVNLIKLFKSKLDLKHQRVIYAFLF